MHNKTFEVGKIRGSQLSLQEENSWPHVSGDEMMYYHLRINFFSFLSFVKKALEFFLYILFLINEFSAVDFHGKRAEVLEKVKFFYDLI